MFVRILDEYFKDRSEEEVKYPKSITKDYYENASLLADTIFSLPIWPMMSLDTVDVITDEINQYYNNHNSENNDNDIRHAWKKLKLQFSCYIDQHDLVQI